jgi:Tol biopolymer transport system component
MAFELSDEGPRQAYLGMGNCPSPSPDGQQIAFLSNEAGRRKGVYLMKSDGTGRTLFGPYGRPHWSPDGQRILISTFSEPAQVTLVNIGEGMRNDVQLPDHQIFSTPRWVTPSAVVAVIGSTSPDQIAVLDVSSPEKARVQSVIWKKAGENDPVPADPVFNAESKRCFFVGIGAEGKAIYSVLAGDPTSRKRLGFEGFDHILGAMALSPDGRFLVFQSDRRISPPR